MNGTSKIVVTALLAGGLGAGVAMWSFNAGQNSATGASHPAPVGKAGATSRSAMVENRHSELETRISALEKSLTELQTAAKNGGNDPRRMEELERTVQALQHNMDGVTLEKASAERQALFAAEEGYLKADE